MRNNKPQALVLIIGFAIACSNCMYAQIETNSNRFNKTAAKTILSKFEGYDLKPFDETERCILKKVIQNDLDKLNNFRTVLLNDRFFIKNYSENYLGVEFSFVEDIINHRYYFVCVPSLFKFIDNLSFLYEEKNDTLFVLKGGEGFQKLATPLLDSLFLNEGFKVTTSDEREIYKQLKAAQVTTYEVLHSVYNEEPINFHVEMENQMKSGLISTSDYDRITKLYNLHLEENYLVDVCKLDYAGYIMFVYSFNKSASDHVKVDVYFLPKKARNRISHAVKSNYWKECSRE